jgi:lysophospholipase L1-like esterase
LTLLWFRLPAWLVMAMNTGLLLLILLPAVDFLTRPPQRIDPHPEVAGNAYLYDVAKKDPHAFRYWWGKYLGQYDKLMREVFMPDSGHGVPFRTRTNSETTFFQSRIRINSLGFRGDEISRDKGDTYRIVAMGESTTFGFTLTPEHLPWPEFLAQSIRERLAPGRQVEVINTGLPHHNLENNLYRLRTEILALKPDMIISYHGWNGFPWLYPSLPPIYEKHYPLFRERPLHLLAECEFRFKMFIFKRHLASKQVLEMPPVSRLLETKYADLYRELIDGARTNNIRLVVGNYSMAVNGNSDRNVCEFYREVFPSVYPAIKVNLMHTMLVKELVRQHPEVIYADTNPGLDGEYRKFIDLVHFAPDGDRQLAENFFAAIKGVLTTNLSVISNR